MVSDIPSGNLEKADWKIKKTIAWKRLCAMVSFDTDMKTETTHTPSLFFYIM
jgi:hypothetical protein